MVQSQVKSSAIKSLTRGSDLIVSGKVIEKSSNWNQGKTRIFTTATLKIDEQLKGENVQGTVEVIYPGGEIGEVGEIYTHMPTFNEKEEVLVFLKKDKNQNTFRVVNGEEGKIAVIRDAKTDQKVTRSNVKIDALKAQIKSIIQTQQ